MNNCKLEGRRGCQYMASVSLLCCPVFLSPFMSFADALPWVCWAEPPAPSPHSSPCSCQGREAQKLPVSALGRQLMAQPCFRNSCSATGAGWGANTLLLFPWGLVGIWEFLSAAVGSDRKGFSTNTLWRICSLFLPGLAGWDFLCLPHRGVY